MQHEWVKSTLGHGETMCRKCWITNREAAVLDLLNDCDAPPPKAANDAAPVIEHDPEDDDPSMVCPVTSQPCLTEQDEFCEDYGCARKAGFDVDRLTM